MFNHTKGIPLAAFMAGAMYFLIRAARDLPTPRMRDVVANYLRREDGAMQDYQAEMALHLPFRAAET